MRISDWSSDVCSSDLNGKVVVTGCLGAGPKSNIIRAKFPDVLSVSGPQDYSSVMNAVHAVVPPAHDPFLDLLPPQGIKLTPKHYAYLKISEGCNHTCSRSEEHTSELQSLMRISYAV